MQIIIFLKKYSRRIYKMKKYLLILFLTVFGLSTFWCKPYPKESLAELKREFEARRWDEELKEKVQLKMLQLAPEISLLNQEDVYYDMKLLRTGEDYQVGLSECQENLFKTNCDYKVIGKHNLHRCFEEKRQGKLVRVGYCSPSWEGWVPKYRASANDIVLWNYIDNTVKVVYKKYQQDQEAKAREAEKKYEKFLEKKEVLRKKVEKYNEDPYTIVFNLTPVKKYHSYKSKGSCNNIPQIKFKTMIEECESDFCFGFKSKRVGVVEVSSENKGCESPDLSYTDQNIPRGWGWCSMSSGLQIKNGKLVCDGKHILDSNILVFVQNLPSEGPYKIPEWKYNLYSYTYQHNIEKEKEYLQLLEENRHLTDDL